METVMAEWGGDADAVAHARAESERLGAGGEYVMQYRCPACKSFFPESLAGLL